MGSLPPAVSGFFGLVWPHRVRLWDAVKKDSSPGFGRDFHHTGTPLECIRRPWKVGMSSKPQPNQEASSFQQLS